MSYPSDISDERDIVHQVCKELNIIWANNGVHIRVIDWKDDFVPNFGDHPQNIINSQIPEYNVFIGIYWTRFGSPTKNYNSGSEEEFYHALNNKKHILLYFSEIKVSLSEIDVNQLKMINDFKEKVKPIGLYKSYNGIDEFRSMLSMHLNQISQKSFLEQKSPSQTETSLPATISKSEQDTDDSEDGFLDTIDDASASIEISTNSLSAITSELYGLTEETRILAERLPQLTGAQNFSEVKRTTNRYAEKMDIRSQRINAETNTMFEHYSKGIELFSRSITIYVEFSPTDFSHIEQSIVAVSYSKDSMKSMASETTRAISTLDGIPRITVGLNKSKRNFQSTFANLLEKIDLMAEMSDKFIENAKRAVEIIRVKSEIKNADEQDS